MKVDFTFLHVDSSDAFKTHAMDRLEKLESFEHKPMDIHVVISMMRHECIVEFLILEGRRKFQSQAISTDFYKSFDKAFDKVRKQMSTRKRKLRNHKHVKHNENMYELYQEQVGHLENEFEPEFEHQVLKKTG